MILFNPTEVEQKFYYNAYPYVFKPKESKTLPDFVAEFGLKRGNKNLVKYTALYDKQVLVTDINYDTMPWKQVISLASARKLFQVGKHFTREDLVAKLKDYDVNTKAGTVQESPDKEEGEGSQGPAIL